MNKNTSKLPTTRPLCQPLLLAAAAILPVAGTPPKINAIDIQAGWNLGNYIDSNSRNATFFLKGNAVWSGNNASIKGNTDSNITIVSDNGAGDNYRITQSGNGSWINYGGGGIHNFTLLDTEVIGNAASYSSANGLFHGDANTQMILNLEGSIFSNFKGTGTREAGAIGIANNGSNLTVKGGAIGVIFAGNTGQDDGAGVLGTHGNNSTLTFQGDTTFVGNTTQRYGGALTVGDASNSASVWAGTYMGMYFTATPNGDGKVVFDNNAAGNFGGAIDYWGDNAESVFHVRAEFIDNYAQGDNTYMKHGGAINVGCYNGRVDIKFKETARFSGNRAIGSNSDNYKGSAFGGAITLSGKYSNTEGLLEGHYSIVFEKAVEFTNNYVLSAQTGGVQHTSHGGAIYVGYSDPNYAKSISLGPGSRLEGNLSENEGGAIYIAAFHSENTTRVGGSVTLKADSTGDIVLKDNYHNVAFTKINDTTYTPSNTTTPGTSNAIHFQGNGLLTLDTQGTGTIHFHDPITGGRDTRINTATINKTGPGTVIFHGTRNNVYAETTVYDGAFVLNDGATHGMSGSAPAQTFTLAGTATLAGERGTRVNAHKLQVHDGATLRLLANGNNTGALTINTEQAITIHPGATLVFELAGTTPENRQSGRLALPNSATFVPVITPRMQFDTSQWSEVLTDTSYASFTLIEGFKHAFADSTSIATAFGLTDDDLRINGGIFELSAFNNTLYLVQYDSYIIPEPATYGLLAGLGALTLALLRRRKTRPKPF
ncbi:MAG: PEP-CTERM sorting domain-containing protein [Puniceicoccales bacterium]|jgi:hypothetical protein|nr:PEP-CTERM sorting domain-containing protein [Puniceicoccales bacterium]